MIPEQISTLLKQHGVEQLRPGQQAAVDRGLFDNRNLLVTTPTASGKTVIAEMAFMHHIFSGGKAVYIVPLKALAAEKHAEFEKKYADHFAITRSVGDFDSSENLARYDLIICTSEKLDSLMRHKVDWVKNITCLIVDEIHLLNDPGRGPTLEVLITMLKRMLPTIQIIGLSATIGNAPQLASWLQAESIEDTWRPVELHKGVYCNGEIEFYPEK